MLESEWGIVMQAVGYRSDGKMRPIDHLNHMVCGCVHGKNGVELQTKVGEGIRFFKLDAAVGFVEGEFESDGKVWWVASCLRGWCFEEDHYFCFRGVDLHTATLRPVLDRIYHHLQFFCARCK